MCVLLRFVLPVVLCCAAPVLEAQSAADLQTLADLKTASQQMRLESEGAVPFRLNATFQTADFMGRPDSQGQWIEEFAKPGSLKRTIKDSNSPENYAPEDQAKIGVPIATSTGTFMQHFLVQALLMPGPTPETVERSKAVVKTQKVGTVSLRCVTLEPLEKNKNAYLQRNASRTYCLAADKPVIRLAQLSYGIHVSYNSIAHFGDRTLGMTVAASQRGRDRGKLQVSKLVAAPELLQANLPKIGTDESLQENHSGAVKLDRKIAGDSVLVKVTPVYPLEAKQKHISGSVVLHVIIGKEGTIESIEVISASADELVESSIEAASQWRYKPFLQQGKPVEVDTTITLNYQFG